MKFQRSICGKKIQLIAYLLNFMLFNWRQALVSFMIAQLSATYPVYVQNAFPLLGVKAVSILFIQDTVMIVLLQAQLTKWVSSYNKILIVGVGAFLMGFGMFVLSFSYIFAIAIISCALWTTGEMLFISTAQLVCYEKGGEKKKGKILGSYQAAYAASSVIGPAVGGFIYQHLGGNMLWYLCAVFGVISLALCYHYKKYD